jgi:large subunit ribosomal protein L23
MNQERLTKVLLAPHISEKSTYVAELTNTYVFKVMKCANKAEVKAAVEKMFDVKVGKVTTVVVKGKIKGSGQRKGLRSDWKKAYVTLAEGQKINVFGGQ